jgi:O-acetyl-ADP-ribose deacetylase
MLYNIIATSSRAAGPINRSIRAPVRNGLAVAVQKGWPMLAFPVLGAGSGSFDSGKAEATMRDELQKSDAEQLDR